MAYLYAKGQVGEIDAIREAADRAFATERGVPFTFLTVMPKIYCLPNYERIHHLYKFNEEIVAVAGNLIDNMKVNGKEYKTSFVGSVSVAPEHQKKGLMVKLMEKINEENIQNKVSFSMLTGNRNRYEYFDYYYTGACYHFNFTRGNIKHEKDFVFDEKIAVEPFLNAESDLCELLKLYNDNVKLTVRNRENFVYSLTNHNSKIYKILFKNKIIGYFSINNALNSVEEIVLPDKSKFLSVCSRIFEITLSKTLNFAINGYERQWIKLLLEYCNNYSIGRDLMVKIYDRKEFLKFAFDLNEEKTFQDGKLILTVEGENISIEIKGGQIQISNTEEKGIVLSKKEFVDLFSHDYFAKDYQISSWFPLPVAVINADKF